VTATDAHILNLRADGWDLLCPAGCPSACEVRLAATEQLRAPPCLGLHPAHVDAGRLVIDCDRQVFDGLDRIDPATAREPILQTRVNRLGHDPIDPWRWSPWRR